MIRHKKGYHYRVAFLLYIIFSTHRNCFQGLRSPKKRSLLGVNEHFEGKHDAENTFSDYFFYLCNPLACKYISNS